MVTEAAETPVVDRILRLIEQQIDGDLSTSAIAAALGFSERHVQRVFKAGTGEPLAKYVRRRRMERAARLLAETDEPVIEVAGRVGYESHSGFTKAFSAYFSATPSTRHSFTSELKSTTNSLWTGEVRHELGSALHRAPKALAGTREETGDARTGYRRHPVYGTVRSRTLGRAGARSHRVPSWQSLRASAAGSRPHPWSPR